jgi:hypothetical protein
MHTTLERGQEKNPDLPCPKRIGLQKIRVKLKHLKRGFGGGILRAPSKSGFGENLIFVRLR